MTLKQHYLKSNFEWPEKLHRFKDLIFCPLDLPPPPEINLDKFLDWAINYGVRRDKDETIINNVVVRSPESQTDEALGYTTWHFCWAKHYSEPNNWVGNFDKLFPELVYYSMIYPFDKITSMVFIVQKQNGRPFLHVDPDEILGMRYYLSNQLGEKLYFHKTHTKLNDRIPQWNIENNKLKEQNWSKHVDTTNKIYAKMPAKRIPFCLTSLRAVHTIDPMSEPEGMKITCGLYGESNFLNPKRTSQYNTDKLYWLLERSVEKYKEFTIWY